MFKQLQQREEFVTESLLFAPCIGRLAGVGRKGEILVQYEGYGPYPARMLAGMGSKELSRPEQRGRELLLVFENGDPEKPVIVGLMTDPLDDLIALEVSGEKGEENLDLLVDGRRITIEAEDEVVLKCGKGSIQIRKDGKIIIKGTDLLSRSSGPQRIRGASVNVN